MNSPDLVSFEVCFLETDLRIHAQSDLSIETEKLVKKCRRILDDYITVDPQFLTSLTPYNIRKNSHILIKQMAKAAEITGVGPMAAVAGAFAEHIGRDLLDRSSEIIVENGGDVFINSSKERLVGIYAGKSRLSRQIGLRVKASNGIGICTSSGTVGHSFSYGSIDAAVVVAQNTALADAAATALGNIVKSESDLTKAISVAEHIPKIEGVILILKEEMAVWGNLDLIEL
jgi:ApbE superfamily uncharacterized protein (UPF0280 family)